MIIQTPDNTHCWFSPSAAARLIRCPGSRKASELLTDVSGPAAQQGTQCHSFMEAYYAGQTVETSTFGFTESWQPEAIEKACEVTDKYIADLIAIHGDPELTLERKTTLPYGVALGVPQGDVFGTIDVCLYFPNTKHLVVLDYKFGHGYVAAEGNEQLQTYAAGMLYEYPETTTIDIVVVQPRLSPPISMWPCEAWSIRAWEKQVLIPAVIAASKDDSPIVPGEIQCKWCKVARTKGCTVQAQPLIDLANSYKDATQNDFGSIEMDPDTLGQLGSELKRFKDFMGHIESAILFRLKCGENIPGFKLVRTGKHKQWKDEDVAEKYLARKGLKQEERFVSKLVSPSQAGKLLAIGKADARAKSTFNGYVETPLGELTFAPESDPRPAVQVEEELIAATDVQQEEVQSVTPEEQAIAVPADLSALF